MLVPITIDTNDIRSQFDITENQIENLLDGIAKSLAVVFVVRLETEAENELHSTRRRYLQNVRVVDSGKLQSTVLLDYSKDPLIRMIEEGQSPWDMKPSFLNGPRSKVTKNGTRYNTIPIRWSTPGAVGENELFSGKMPQEIYSIVRKGNGPLKIGEVPAQFQIQKRPQIKDSEGKVLFEEYKHKSSIYAGISKHTDTTTAQSTYVSFRRVSENSDANAFINKGMVAKHLMDRAYQKMDLENEIQLQLDNQLSQLGF